MNGNDIAGAGGAAALLVDGPLAPGFLRPIPGLPGRREDGPSIGVSARDSGLAVAPNGSLRRTPILLGGAILAEVSVGEGASSGGGDGDGADGAFADAAAEAAGTRAWAPEAAALEAGALASGAEARAACIRGTTAALDADFKELVWWMI